MRAIRGAITVNENNRDQILKSTNILLKKIIDKNQILETELVSITFTATEDLDRVYPAVAAREMGYSNVPLFCCQEMKVTDSLPRCIRVLIYINRNCEQTDIKHVYLRKARNLRPDLLKN